MLVFREEMLDGFVVEVKFWIETEWDLENLVGGKGSQYTY